MMKIIVYAAILAFMLFMPSGLLGEDFTEEAQANYGVGLLYSIEQDYQEAFKWFTKAAEQGHAGAQLNLGLMYYNGEGVPQDYKEAAKWFTRSAGQGRAEAQVTSDVNSGHET